MLDGLNSQWEETHSSPLISTWDKILTFCLKYNELERRGGGAVTACLSAVELQVPGDRKYLYCLEVTEIIWRMHIIDM